MIKAILMFCSLLVLNACGRNAEPVSSTASGKSEGPNVKTLSHTELMAVLHECHQYGSSDDPQSQIHDVLLFRCPERALDGRLHDAKLSPS